MNRAVKLNKKRYSSTSNFVESHFIKGTIYNTGTTTLIFWGETILPNQSFKMSEVTNANYNADFDIDFEGNGTNQAVFIYFTELDC